MSRKNFGMRTIDPKKFGLMVKKARENMRLTQIDMAEKIGVSDTTIQNYENGTYPQGRHLAKLAIILNCSADWLLFGDSGNNPNIVNTNGITIKDVNVMSHNKINAGQNKTSLGEVVDMIEKIRKAENRTHYANMMRYLKLLSDTISMEEMNV